MATGRVPTTANSPLTAKGDLFGYSTTQARVAVGNDGETLVADSSTSTGLRYQGTMAAGKNAIINGNFDIWQRGTSFASTTGYFADRWTNIGDLSSVTASQQTTGAPDGSRYILRLTSTAASSYWSSYQFMETSTASTLWGKTVVFSAKVRRNATMTSGINIFVQKSATSDAGSGATWTTVGTLAVANASMPTGTTSADWYFASSSIAIPNDGTANSLRLVINYGAAAASGSVLEISQVQLELGSVATTFTRAGGTIQGELAACQRYYWRSTTSTSGSHGIGATQNATSAIVGINLPVTMRVVPTSIDFTNLRLVNYGVAAYSISTITLSTTETTQNFLNIDCSGATGMTANRPVFLYGTGSAGYIGASAEL
jgi:hypothetical protein